MVYSLNTQKTSEILSLFDWLHFINQYFIFVCVILSKIVIFVLLDSIFPLFDVYIHLYDWGLVSLSLHTHMAFPSIILCKPIWA